MGAKQLLVAPQGLNLPLIQQEVHKPQEGMDGNIMERILYLIMVNMDKEEYTELLAEVAEAIMVVVLEGQIVVLLALVQAAPPTFLAMEVVLH